MSRFTAPTDYRIARRGGRVALPAPANAGKVKERNDQLIIPENLPRFLSLPFGFKGTPGGAAGAKGISVPAGFNAGSSAAWYPLLDLDPAEKLGQQAAFFAVAGAILPTGYNATTGTGGGANDQTWGSVQGWGAAIVLGTDLPIVDGAWTVAPCPLPGVSGEGAADGEGSRYLWWTSFPPGSYLDTLPPKGFMFESFAPYVADIPLGKRLQAALVVEGLANGGGTTKNLCGGAFLRAMVGQTDPVGGFAKR